MRKKALSISGISGVTLAKVTRIRAHSILTCPNPPQPQEFNSETPCNAEKSRHAHRESEDFRIRKLKPAMSFSQKTLKAVKSKEEIKCPKNLLDQIDTIEKCRKVFDKIIEKDKKFGGILAKIKSVYERELERKPKLKCESRLNLNLIAVNKEEKNDLQVSGKVDRIVKVRKRTILSDEERNKEPVSDLETVHTSGRGQIPELTLGNIERANFHDEFMANYNYFSESWRKMVNK